MAYMYNPSGWSTQKSSGYSIFNPKNPVNNPIPPLLPNMRPGGSTASLPPAPVNVPSVPPVKNPPPPGLGFNFQTAKFGVAGLDVLGNLGSAYAAIKGLGLARDQLKFQKDAFNRNFAQQQTAYRDNVTQYNNAQGERQAFVNATHADPSLSNIQNLQVT